MKASGWLLLFLCLTGTFLAHAEDVNVEDTDGVDESDQVDEDADEYEEDMDAHEVKTSYFFPEYKEKRLPVGKEVTVLVDFSNDGQDVFNVTRVAAFLHSRFDFDYYVQNFTTKEVSGLAAPNSQVSLEFKFKPDKGLETVEFILSGFVEYRMEGSDEPFQLMFMNNTVELYDDASGIDFATVSTYLMMLAAFGGLGYYAMNLSVVKGITKKKRVPRKVESAAAPEWEVETYQEKKSSTVRRKKGGAKQK